MKLKLDAKVLLSALGDGLTECLNMPSLEDIKKWCNDRNFIIHCLETDFNNRFFLEEDMNYTIPNSSGILENYVWVSDDNFSEQKEQPMGIVIHSGSRGRGIAEYAENEPDGRTISYHFAWSSKRHEFVQMVSLNNRAWHAGIDGNDWIGICLPGPLDSKRSGDEMIAFRGVVRDLVSRIPDLKYWTRHSDINDRKRDPGPGFTDRWMSGLGLKHAHFATNDMARRIGDD